MSFGEKLNLIIIGHWPKQVSGSALMVKDLVNTLQKKEEIEIQFIDSSRDQTRNWAINLLTAIRVSLAVLLNIKKGDVVVLLASSPAMGWYAPILFLLTRTFGKPLILRLLGGALDTGYQRMNSIRRKVFELTVLKADIIFFETRYLSSYFSQLGARRAEWYPNCRQMLDLEVVKENNKSHCKRFVFLGRVTKEKGIDVILDSIPSLMDGISIDIFGPLDGSFTADYIDFHGKNVVRYKGILSPEQVREGLFEYDALILPTFYEGEGYPGVILEAYSQGMPVIVTKWRFIPEIVDETSGILIPPHSPEALADAINNLYSNPKLYQRLRRGVLRKRDQFSEPVWADRFVQQCVDICGSKTKLSENNKILHTLKS